MNKVTYATLSDLLKNRVFYNFAEICKIPHPSFHEEKLSNYLFDWAKSLGLEASQDNYHNVMIRKNGTSGYENSPAVLLQAHIDMVCEKAPGVEHDFYTDPIPLQLDDVILSTGGKTTLGADNGIGVAYIMTLLESNDMAHPPIEALFTTAEEEDFSGALNVDGSWFNARKLINLDFAVDNEILCGSAGGNAVELTKPVTYIDTPSNSASFKLSISGMPGGHSGEDIHRGHGSATILLARLLHDCQQQTSCSLADIKCGSFRLAIPRDAFAVITVTNDMVSTLEDVVTENNKTFLAEYGDIAHNMSVSIEKCDKPTHVMSAYDFDKLLLALYLSPNGISEMFGTMTGVVESSDNMGEVHIKDDVLYIVYELRAAHESARNFINDKIKLVASLSGFKYRAFSDYPSWVYNPESPLLALVRETYTQEFTDKPKATVFHAGVECGCLMAAIPDLDAVAFGPNAWSFHSPSERVDVQSVDKSWALLKALLIKMK